MTDADEAVMQQKLLALRKVLNGAIKELINKIDFLTVELDCIADFAFVTRQDYAIRIKAINEIHNVRTF